MSFQIRISSKVALIANGTSLSGAIDLAGSALLAMAMPAAWTAAGLTLQASADGSSYNDVYDSGGTEYTITAAAGRFILLNPADFAGMRYLKIRSGTAGVPVNQGAERTLTLAVRPIY